MLGFFGFLLWLGFCGAVATAADTRGRSSGGWFLLAFFVTPLLAVCFLLALPKVDREQELEKRIAAAVAFRELRVRRREKRREWRDANLWPPLRKLWAVTPREVYPGLLLILSGGACWSMSTGMVVYRGTGFTYLGVSRVTDYWEALSGAVLSSPFATIHTTPMGVTYYDPVGAFFGAMYILSFTIAMACLAFLLISGVIRVAQLLLRQTRGTA